MNRSFRILCAVSLTLASLAPTAPAGENEDRFSFAPHLDLERPAPTLRLGDVLIEGRTVRLHGSDAAEPTRPFHFDWGDGQATEGWFPATHTYLNAERDYVITVTARYEPASRVHSA